MSETKKYCSYDNYHIIYDTVTNCFDVYYKKKPIAADVCIESICDKDGTARDLTGWEVLEVKNGKMAWEKCGILFVLYGEKGADAPSFTLRISVVNDVVEISVEDNPADTAVKIEGRLLLKGNCDKNVFPVCFDREGSDMRSAAGNAISTVEHALYNRENDTAVVVGKAGQTALRYDTADGEYRFVTTVCGDGKWENAQILFKEDVLSKMYNVVFSPINRNATFPRVPVGFMTWYAVKFDACEEKVLTNAAFQAEHLKEYGANAVWVDWEWCHRDMTGDRDDGVNSLHPDPKMYPNGLKYVADKIKEMGMVPALWLGFMNDPSKNEYVEKYPDMVLVDHQTWCGRYYYDFTNPHYLNDYLPAALSNVHAWGYEAVKFDTIPISVAHHEMYHSNMYDPSLTTKEAYRQMIQKVRAELGENMYMLSCCGSYDASVLWASDVFEAARISSDIFTWEDYLKTVGRIYKFYPLHNIQLYVDADNVVLREEFSDVEQAKARTALVSLLGLPMTFGDEFSALDEERITLIKKSLPILDIHPVDLCSRVKDDGNILINLMIKKDYEEYLVTGAFNLTENTDTHTVRLEDDLHLEKGTYLAYDFYRDEFLGKVADEITLDHRPYECRILALRKYSGVPQVVSTSRHITQGAAEISGMRFADNKLTLTASLVKNDAYTVTVYVPDGFELAGYQGFEKHTQKDNLLKLTLMPEKTGEYSFSVDFKS